MQHTEGANASVRQRALPWTQRRQRATMGQQSCAPATPAVGVAQSAEDCVGQLQVAPLQPVEPPLLPQLALLHTPALVLDACGCHRTADTSAHCATFTFSVQFSIARPARRPSSDVERATRGVCPAGPRLSGALPQVVVWAVGSLCVCVCARAGKADGTPRSPTTRAGPRRRACDPVEPAWRRPRRYRTDGGGGARPRY